MGQADIGTLFRMQMNRLMFGISGGDQAKVLAAQVNISGLTKQQALNVQSQVASFAAMNAVLPSKVFEDMASNTEMFAKFATSVPRTVFSIRFPSRSSQKNSPKIQKF